METAAEEGQPGKSSTSFQTSPLKSLKKISKNPLFLRLKRFFARIPTQYVLFVALVPAAYYIGVLRTEVGYLKAERGNVAAAQAGGQSALGSAAAAQKGSVPEVTDRDHVRGSRNAKVFLIEYSDLECPFCKQFHPTVKQVLDEYDDDVAWVYRHYPLAFHANAQKESEASECVAELGSEDKFWDYVDEIFQRTTSNGTGFALDKLGPLAAEVGVNQSKFQQCLDSAKYAQYVKDQMAAGTKAGVSGTPGNFIVSKGKDTRYLPGALPLEQIKQAIEPFLK